MSIFSMIKKKIDGRFSILGWVRENGLLSEHIHVHFTLTCTL